jgi:hypothetical protein
MTYVTNPVSGLLFDHFVVVLRVATKQPEAPTQPNPRLLRIRNIKKPYRCASLQQRDPFRGKEARIYPRKSVSFEINESLLSPLSTPGKTKDLQNNSRALRSGTGNPQAAARTAKCKTSQTDQRQGSYPLYKKRRIRCCLIHASMQCFSTNTEARSCCAGTLQIKLCIACLCNNKACELIRARNSQSPFGHPVQPVRTPETRELTPSRTPARTRRCGIPPHLRHRFTNYY